MNSKTYSIFVLAFLLAQGLVAQPTITSFSPASGNIGTTVTITGTNFGSTLADNIVYFGAVRAAVSASTSTSLTVTVPVGATYQPITVTAGGLTAFSAIPFVVTFPGAFPQFSDSSFARKIDSLLPNAPGAICLGDFDGDGKPDLALIDGNSYYPSAGGIFIFKNTSTPGKISLATRLPYPTSQNNVPSITAIDVDGDGLPDIAITDNDNYQVLVYRNTSGGGTISFDNPVSLPTSRTGPFAGLAAGDFDGDGKTDLVIGGPYALVAVFRNTSTVGNISFTRTDINSGNLSPMLVAVGDIDGDNKPDIIIGNEPIGEKLDPYVRVSVLRNTCTAGNISFDAVNTVVNIPGGYTNGLAIGDLDGDGKLDLAATDSASSTVYVFRNTSSPGTLSVATGIAYQAGNSAISIADLDGDGKADLIVSGYTGGVSLLKNLSIPGTPSFAAKIDFITGSGSPINCVSDIDGDGKPDLIVGNYNATISLLRNKISESTVKPSGANPVTGVVVKTVTIDPTVQSYNGLPYVQRHYDIEPAINPATSTATITLYFSQLDFDNFNAYPNHGYSLPTGPADAAGKASLRIFQYHGFSTTSDPSGYSGSAVEIDPADNNIIWNADSQLWGVTFDVTGFSGFFISSAASALPLNLLSFTATAQGNNALLKWTTANETNTSYFELQRSTDGSSFTGIAKINAAGNSIANLNYQYTDALGTDPAYYYRLKMVDIDAATTYSGIARITNSDHHQPLGIYPNPANDNVSISHPASNSNATLKLVDMTGKLLQIITLNGNSLQTSLNIGGIAAGVYKIIWSDGAKTFSQTLLIQH